MDVEDVQERGDSQWEEVSMTIVMAECDDSETQMQPGRTMKRTDEYGGSQVTGQRLPDCESASVAT